MRFGKTPARPGAVTLARSPRTSLTSWGRATESPIVATILISGETRRRCRNSSQYSSAPSAGAKTSSETRAAGQIAQPFSVFSQ